MKPVLEPSDDQFEEALTLLALGRAYHEQSQWDIAELYYRQSLEIFRIVDTQLYQAEALFRLCQLNFDRGELKHALEYASKTQEIALAYNFCDWVGRSLLIVGDIALNQNHTDDAGSAYAQACIYALEHSSILFKRICRHVDARITELRTRNSAAQSLTLHSKMLSLLDERRIGRESLGEMLREPESPA